VGERFAVAEADDLGVEGRQSFEGVGRLGRVGIAQRVLAMAAAIWHNNQTGAPTTRSLIAYDH
jgi:hypothetical protein